MLNRAPRLCFEGIEKFNIRDKNFCEIKVNLSFEKRVFQGFCCSELGKETEIATTAETTLRAIEEFVSHRFSATLLDIDLVEAVGAELIVLLVKLNFQDRELQLFGTCRIGDNLLESAVRAALDATNRYVEFAWTNTERAGIWYTAESSQ